MSNKELPTSIKVISWFYQVIGGILIFLGILALFGVTLVANLFGRAQLGVVGGVVVLLILGGLGFLVILLGRGLLIQNKFAFWVALILSALNAISLISGGLKNLGVVPLAINLLIIWKLYEYRGLFLPEGLPWEAPPSSLRRRSSGAQVARLRRASRKKKVKLTKKK